MYDFVIKIRFYRICKALELEPRKALKDYVFDDNLYIFGGGRRNGKTTAAIVKAMVYKQIPPQICTSLLDHVYSYDPDYDSNHKERLLFYEDQTMKCVSTCIYKGIDVCMKHSDYRRIRKKQKMFKKYIKNNINITKHYFK